MEDEAMERSIKTHYLFKSQTVAAGTSGVSDTIDLRDDAKVGNFSLSYTIDKTATGQTCGTVSFSYSGCPVYDGTYVTPSTGSFATCTGTGGTSDIVSFSPVVTPFMKITANVGTSGTSGVKVTAALHIR